MSRRSILLGVLAWMVVVAVTSGVTWAVINAVGQQVLSGSDIPARLQPDQAADRPTRSTAPIPTPSAAETPAPATPDRQRSWQAEPGSVTVRCGPSGAALGSASPNDGYRVQVGSRGPGEVEVTFQGGRRDVRVRSTCVAGVPRFATATETETGTENEGGSGPSDD